MRRFFWTLISVLALLLVWQVDGGGVALAAGGEHAGDQGPPWTAIGFHALNFVVFVGVAVWASRGLIRDALQNRATAIRVDIEKSQRTREEAQRRFEDLQQRIAGLEGQLVTMRQQAEAEAAKEEALIAERAQRDVVMIQEASERAIRNEIERARTLLRREAVDLAVDLATQQLRGQVGAAENDQLTQQLITAIHPSQAPGANHV